MADVAVVAHAGKTLGGGLPELREILAREGVTDPLWYEVKKSRRAPKYARRAAAHGADVLFVWGGDGSVQRCIDAVAGTDTAVAILPAGTANLPATNLGQGHAGKEDQHQVRPQGPLRARRRRAPGHQETARQGPSRLSHGLRPTRAAKCSRGHRTPRRCGTR